MTATPLAALLEGLVDYAGLFPPAGLSMQDAVQNYARYRQGPHARMLGRFVVPEDRLIEVPVEFRLSVLWSGNSFPVGIPTTATLETKAATRDDVERIAAHREGRTVYVEIADLSLIEPIGRAGLRAKFRTGGVTPDAFPPLSNIVDFLRACHAAAVPFKATAGLHHPLRCVRPLTYEPNAATGTMHGFLNVFLAATMLDHADAILAEEEAVAFTIDDDAITWRGHRATTEAIAAARRKFAISFGSCSFEEPVGDLQALGWL
ncbi:MAG TPA: hypothetical protein VF701_04665 [Thermoanaerobaculia bacterium]